MLYFVNMELKIDSEAHYLLVKCDQKYLKKWWYEYCTDPKVGCEQIFPDQLEGFRDLHSKGGDGDDVVEAAAVVAVEVVDKQEYRCLDLQETWPTPADRPSSETELSSSSFTVSQQQQHYLPASWLTLKSYKG